MGMNVGGRRKGARAEINITPLIDVVLVLLIIFMVLQQASRLQMTANVPDKSGPTQEAAHQIVLRVRAGPKLALDDEPVEPQALVAAVAAKLRRDQHKAVFFQVEDAVPYGDVVRLMDVVKGAGALVLAVITQD
jgi:biopolymer transport protein ExbD